MISFYFIFFIFILVWILGFFGGLCRSTRSYGEKGERFEQLTFLILAQNVVCFAWLMLSKTLRTIPLSRHLVVLYKLIFPVL